MAFACSARAELDRYVDDGSPCKSVGRFGNGGPAEDPGPRMGNSDRFARGTGVRGWIGRTSEAVAGVSEERELVLLLVLMLPLAELLHCTLAQSAEMNVVSREHVLVSSTGGNLSWTWMSACGQHDSESGHVSEG